MKRDPHQLTEKTFDLLVIGGGIYGAFIAWDAVLRGLSVALIEKGDFGHGTSANSLKTIHGGLRCLQQGDIFCMRRLQKEQKAFYKIAPHLVYPMPFLIPTYKWSIYAKICFKMAFGLRKLLSSPQSASLSAPPDSHDGRILLKNEIKALFPGLPDANLTGGAGFTDCLLHHPERLLLSVLRGAVSKGAVIANYMDVTGVLRRENRIEGVQAIDRLTEKKIEIRARVTVNATGPWINRIIRFIGGRTVHFPMARGINLIVDRQSLKDIAIGIPDNDNHEIKNLFVKKSRLIFMIPWYGYSLIGSHYIPCHDINDQCPVTEPEIDEFLGIINAAAGLALKRDNVLWAYSGYVSVSTSKSGRIKRTQKQQIFDHRKHDGIDGIISVFGMKYTEARYKAEKVVDMVFKKLREKSPSCRTAITPLYGGDMTDIKQLAAEKKNELSSRLTGADIRYLISHYGTRFTEILKYLPETAPDGLSPIDIAEIRHSADSEMAIKLQDVMLRRTLRPLISENRFACEEYSRVMAQAQNWDEDQRVQELQEIKSLLNRRSSYGPDIP